MRSDNHGVAGFLEDLPVLMFVLAGTFTIVVSSQSASEAVFQQEESSRLDELANACVGRLVFEILDARQEIPPTIGSLCSTRLFEVAEEFLEGHGFCLGVLMLHPEPKCIVQSVWQITGFEERTSSASRLFNALTDDGRLAIMVVRILVS